MMNSPLGPGFFIFFQRKSDLGSGSPGPEILTENETEDRIRQDDEEILLFIQIINKSLL